MGFPRIKECLDLVIFFLSSICLQPSFPPHHHLLVFSLSAFFLCLCVSQDYPPQSLQSNNKWQHHRSGPFQNTTQKMCVVATLTCNNPPNRPLWVLYLLPLSFPPTFPPLFSLLGLSHFHPPLPLLFTARASEPQWRSGAPCRRCFVT